MQNTNWHSAQRSKRSSSSIGLGRNDGKLAQGAGGEHRVPKPASIG